MLCTPKLAFAPTLLLWSVVQWSSAVGRSKNLEEGASRSSRFFKLGIRICLLIFLPKLGGGGIYLSSCPHGSDGPVMYSCSFPSCWPISFDSLLRKHGYNGTHSLTFIWNSGVFFQQIILDAGVPKTFFCRIIVLAVFFSVNSIVVFLRKLTTKTLCLSIRTIDSQWDKTIYERQAFLCCCKKRQKKVHDQ